MTMTATYNLLIDLQKNNAYNIIIRRHTGNGILTHSIKERQKTINKHLTLTVQENL